MVGSGPLPLEICVLPAVARLAKLHPKLRIRIVEGAWRELPGMLLLGSVDLVILEASTFDNDNRVDVELLPRHQAHLVCRIGHPLSRLTSVSRADLDPYPFVGISMNRAISARMGKTFRLLAVDHLTGDVLPHIATSSLCAMREIVRRTDGLALCPRQPLEADLRAGQLTLLDTDFELPTTNYGIATLSGRTLSHAAAEFIRAVREVEADINPEGKYARSHISRAFEGE